MEGEEWYVEGEEGYVEGEEGFAEGEEGFIEGEYHAVRATDKKSTEEAFVEGAYQAVREAVIWDRDHLVGLNLWYDVGTRFVMDPSRWIHCCKI